MITYEYRWGFLGRRKKSFGHRTFTCRAAVPSVLFARLQPIFCNSTAVVAESARMSKQASGNDLMSFRPVSQVFNMIEVGQWSLASRSLFFIEFNRGPVNWVHFLVSPALKISVP